MRSIGITSWGSSTTQITAGSRRVSWQKLQRGPSARLKHTSHSPICGLGLADRVGEGQRLLVALAQEVERQPLRGARADAGQLAQLGHEPLDGRGLHR